MVASEFVDLNCFWVSYPVSKAERMVSLVIDPGYFLVAYTLD